MIRVVIFDDNREQRDGLEAVLSSVPEVELVGAFPSAVNVLADVGDFVLKRADGDWAYQLAVVVDDAAQGITHVVRGADLADNTPRQLLLQAALGIATPAYLHTPLVLAADGAKLSKQHGAAAVSTDSAHEALATLCRAAEVLGLPKATGATSAPQALAFWVAAWRALYNCAP